MIPSSRIHVGQIVTSEYKSITGGYVVFRIHATGIFIISRKEAGWGIIQTPFNSLGYRTLVPSEETLGLSEWLHIVYRGTVNHSKTLDIGNCVEDRYGRRFNGDRV